MHYYYYYYFFFGARDLAVKFCCTKIRFIAHVDRLLALTLPRSQSSDSTRSPSSSVPQVRTPSSSRDGSCGGSCGELAPGTAAEIPKNQDACQESAGKLLNGSKYNGAAPVSSDSDQVQPEHQATLTLREANKEQREEVKAEAVEAEATGEEGLPPPPPPLPQQQQQQQQRQQLPQQREDEKEEKIASSQASPRGDKTSSSIIQQPHTSATATSSPLKRARCKRCGELVLRTVEAIENHSLSCKDQAASDEPKVSLDTQNDMEEQGCQIGATRIIGRTPHGSCSSSDPSQPFQSCAFQDSFLDSDGVGYVYEISVTHEDFKLAPGHLIQKIPFKAHVIKQDTANRALITLNIISEIHETRARRDNLRRVYHDLKHLKKKLDDGVTLGIESERCCASEGDACVEDFELLTVLGRGGFGKVMMVRHKENRNIYAMKILKKEDLLRRRQVERTRTERHILEKVSATQSGRRQAKGGSSLCGNNSIAASSSPFPAALFVNSQATGHPFIVSLAYAFQTSQKLYMVMDFVQGGDFFAFLRKVRRVKESWAQLYICELALALQALHDIEVVYRDLKPENVLMERDGHIKLTDFGLSRSFEMRHALPDDKKRGKGAMGYTTRSFCGTEQYMSPEMLLQRGHTKAMDWWCLGLFMHEMLTGKHPFQGTTHYDTLRNMVTRNPAYGAGLSDAAKSLMMGLLTKDCSKRFGCSPLGAKELQVHRFFIGLNWNKVLKKEIPAPYIPPLSSNADTSSFEEVFTKEQAVDSVVQANSSRRKDWVRWLGKLFGAKDDGSKRPSGGGLSKPKNGNKTGGALTTIKRKESLSDFEGFSFKADAATIEKAGKSTK